MKINIYNRQQELSLECSFVYSIVNHFLKCKNIVSDELSLYFVNTSEICSLHSQFFNDPSPTDCISFPVKHYSFDTYSILGDIFICPQTAINYANEHKLDPYKEIALYIIHGLLHLIGYNDIEEKDRIVMNKEEQKIFTTWELSK